MQLPLFAAVEPRVDLDFRRASRIELSSGAWVEWVPGWFAQHHTLFEELRQSVTWKHQQTVMFERRLAVPRLLGTHEQSMICDATLLELAASLSSRYQKQLGSVSFALYRDGRDSVAMHGDKMGPQAADTVVAVLALGSRRGFLLKPKRGGRSMRFHSGEGDLLVMGGSCQEQYLHGVPKVARAGPRLSVMFRPAVEQPDTLRSALPRPEHRGMVIARRT